MITTIRRSRQWRRCERAGCHLLIRPGQRYARHALPPGGDTGWVTYSTHPGPCPELSAAEQAALEREYLDAADARIAALRRYVAALATGTWDERAAAEMPSGCRHCRMPERAHGLYPHPAPAIGWHTYVPPTDAQILARMRARRARQARRAHPRGLPRRTETP